MATPRTPQEVHQAFARSFNARNVDELLSLYEPTASLVLEPGKVLSGAPAIREGLAGLAAIDGEMLVETIYIIETGDLALTRSSWVVNNGGAVAVQGSGSEIMRRGADGVWRFVADHPFGANPDLPKDTARVSR